MDETTLDIEAAFDALSEGATSGTHDALLTLETYIDALERKNAELLEFRKRVDDGWVPFGWFIGLRKAKVFPLEFEGDDGGGFPVWERSLSWPK
jgi:hypothetical protein